MSLATLTTPVKGLSDQEVLDDARAKFSEANKLYPRGSVERHMAYARYDAAYKVVYGPVHEAARRG